MSIESRCVLATQTKTLDLDWVGTGSFWTDVGAVRTICHGGLHPLSAPVPTAIDTGAQLNSDCFERPTLSAVRAAKHVRDYVAISFRSRADDVPESECLTEQSKVVTELQALT